MVHSIWLKAPKNHPGAAEMPTSKMPAIKTRGPERQSQHPLQK